MHAERFPVSSRMVAAQRPTLWPSPAQATHDNRLMTKTINLQPAVQSTTQPHIFAMAPPNKRWKPRSGEGFVAWDADLTDRLSTNQLYDTSIQPPPTLEQTQAAFPHLSGYDLFDVYLLGMEGYNDENTQLYHLIMSTIDLSGPREEADLKYIARLFHNGTVRDGQGLLKWLKGLHDSSGSSEQDDLQVKLANMKLQSHANIMQVEQHCIDMLSTWERVIGNDISEPASFNWRLLHSLPPGTHPIGALRAWLADKITDNASEMLRTPETLIDKVVKHVKNIGVPDPGSGSGSSAFVTSQSNKCKSCDCFGCDGQPCLAFTTDADISKLSAGMQAFVRRARDYIKAHPEVKTIKNVKLPKSTSGANEKGLGGQPLAAPMVAAPSTGRAAFEAWLEKMSNGHHVQMMVGGETPRTSPESPADVLRFIRRSSIEAAGDACPRLELDTKLTNSPNNIVTKDKIGLQLVDGVRLQIQAAVDQCASHGASWVMGLTITEKTLLGVVAFTFAKIAVKPFSAKIMAARARLASALMLVLRLGLLRARIAVARVALVVHQLRG